MVVVVVVVCTRTFIVQKFGDGTIKKKIFERNLILTKAHLFYFLIRYKKQQQQQQNSNKYYNYYSIFDLVLKKHLV